MYFIPYEGIPKEALGETQGMATYFGRPVGDPVGVEISHSLLSHGGQAWTCPYILLSLEASALLRQYTRSSLSTGYEPGPALYPKTTAKITSHRE